MKCNTSIAILAGLILTAGGECANRAGNGKPASSAPDPATRVRALSLLRNLPLYFEPNVGQAEPAVRYIARASGYTLLLTDTEAIMVFRRGGGKAAAWRRAKETGTPLVMPEADSDEPPAVIRMKLKGGNRHVEFEPLDKLPGTTGYLIGDSKLWRTGVPQYAKVRLKGVYPGIDMVFYGAQGRTEFDFVVQPGADPGRIRLAYEGASGLRVDDDGNLVLGVRGGELIQHRPHAYQGAKGSVVESRYELRNRREVALNFGAYDRAKALVVDPILSYATYLGGEGDDYPAALVVDSTGNIFIAGYSTSTRFAGAQFNVPAGSQKAFVVGLDPTGTHLLWVIYFGGTGNDVANGLAVDSNGGIYFAGATQGGWTATSGAYQRTFGGGFYDGYVVKLTRTLSVVYATYLGGSGDDIIWSLGIDPSGNAYAAGETPSNTTFPLRSPAQGTYGGGPVDAFVTKLNTTGSDLIYSTFLGGRGEDAVFGVAVDSSGYAYVAGRTTSDNLSIRPPNPVCFTFPCPTNDLPQAFAGQQDAFAAKLSPSGAIVYNTYLGGTSVESGTAVAADSAGNAYVVGRTGSSNFSTTSGAFQRTFRGGNAIDPNREGSGPYDGFVVKINSAGTARVFSTLLGGTSYDGAFAVAVDAAGTVYVSGDTSSSDFPTANPTQPTNRGLNDLFITRLSADGSKLLFSSYFGGSGDDLASAVTVPPSGDVYIAGYATPSFNFPKSATTQPLFNYAGGPHDAFAAKLASADLFMTTAPIIRAPGINGVPPRNPDVNSGGPCELTVQAGNKQGSSTADGSTTFDLSSSVVGGTSTNVLNWLGCTEDSGRSCTIQNGNQVVVSGDLPPGQSVKVKVACSVSGSVPGGSQVQVKVSVRSETNDPNISDNVYLMPFTVANGPAIKPSPENLVFTYQPGGTLPAKQTVSLTTLTSAQWAYGIQAGVTSPPGGTWLSVSSQSGVTPGSVDVNVNPAGLGSGTYQGTVTAGALGWPYGPTLIPVTLIVGCASVSKTSHSFSSSGGSGSFTVTGAGSCPFSVADDSDWITMTSGSTSSPVTFQVAANSGSSQRTGTITVTVGNTNIYVRVVQDGQGGPPPPPGNGLRFIPVTPCRVADTRNAFGTFGGPRMSAGSTRSFPVPQSACGIPSNAKAYSLNVTVVPAGPLSYLTAWPSGQAQPLVSTLNSFGGDIVANAAIVPAGDGGAISIYVTDATDVILDINGYFAPVSTASQFYAVTPCRVADTRNAFGTFGGPQMGGGNTRSFPVPQTCGIPSSAQAYSLNMTVVPSGPLSYLTTWPAGQSQPLVSTLNSFKGEVVANAAIVPAGSGGSISVYVTDTTHVIIDINGYFGPPGGAGALDFYTAAPCRVADTRNTNGPFGGPMITTSRDFAVPSGGCSIPSTAKAYSVNVTVVPPGPLSYLTAWPTGQSMPVVSTLNSFLGKVVANAAIIPSGASGSISFYVSNPSHVLFDINGYFTP